MVLGVASVKLLPKLRVVHEGNSASRRSVCDIPIVQIAWSAHDLCVCGYWHLNVFRSVVPLPFMCLAVQMFLRRSVAFFYVARIPSGVVLHALSNVVLRSTLFKLRILVQAVWCCIPVFSSCCRQ